MSRSFVIIFFLIALCFEPFSAAKAGSFQYHAARRAVARSIAKQGVNPAKFRATSRFGAGFYTANRRSTALAEKGRNSAVLRFKKSGYLKKNAIDLSRPNSSKVRALVGTKANLRGAMKGNVIGPKLGRKIGTAAGRQGKAIVYTSVKDGGANVFIPKRVFQNHPRILTNRRLVKP